MIMLNITGGGEERAKAEGGIIYAEPHLVMDPETPADEVAAKVESLFR